MLVFMVGIGPYARCELEVAAHGCFGHHRGVLIYLLAVLSDGEGRHTG